MPMKVRATRLRTFEVSRPLSDVNLYGCGEGGSVSCTLSSPAASLVSCLPLSPGPCLKSRVSCLLLLSLVSCPLSRVLFVSVLSLSCLSCLSCVLFVSCLVFVSSNPVSFLCRLLSPISYHLSRLLSLVSSLLCPLSCLSLVFLSLVFLSLVVLSSCLLSFFGSCLSCLLVF